MHLTDPLLDQSRTMFVDNWYSSPKNFVAVNNRGTNAIGTVCTNTISLPKKVGANPLCKGEMEVRQLPPLTYITWNDSRQVSMLTNCHSRQEKINTRKSDPVTRQTIFKPDIIQLYNQNMDGVDLVDQETQAFPSMHKTIKWYKKLFLLMMDIVIYNSLVIWKALHPGQQMTILDFRLAISCCLVE